MGLTGFDSKDSRSVSMPGIEDKARPVRDAYGIKSSLKTIIGETNYALAA